MIARAPALAYALAAAVSLGACYSPAITDGQFSCQQGESCPSGFHCLCGLCRFESVTSCNADLGGGDGALDAGLDQSTPDLAGDMSMCALPGCSNGCRSSVDPGHAKVALCPAAWTTAGINTPSSCAHQPTPNGRNAQGTDCAAEDNCANGWHICMTESEASGNGLTVNECDAVTGGLWVSAQIGDSPTTDMGMPAGPPQCNIARVHFVFGCGSYGMTPMQCTLFDRVLVDPPGGSDPCSAETSGTFTCSSAGPGAPVMNVVSKPALAGGGVICCLN